MKVIFVKTLKNQGKKGYAVIHNKENLRKLEIENSKRESQEKQAKEEATKLKKELSTVVLEFKVKTGAGDKVFGSISQKQIKDALEKKNYKIDKNQIVLKSSIASLGFHNVDINLYPGIDATIKVHLVK